MVPRHEYLRVLCPLPRRGQEPGSRPSLRLLGGRDGPPRSLSAPAGTRRHHRAPHLPSAANRSRAQAGLAQGGQVSRSKSGSVAASLWVPAHTQPPPASCSPPPWGRLQRGRLLLPPAEEGPGQACCYYKWHFTRRPGVLGRRRLCGPPLSFVSSSPGGRHSPQPTGAEWIG